MATRIASTRRLLEALEAEGYPIPPDCREARLVMGVACPFVVEFECYVSLENLGKLSRAMLRISEAR